MSSTPESADDHAVTPVDERLLSAHDLARAALLEITPESTIGEPAGYTLEDGGVVSLRFYNRMAGYPHWFWTVSVAVVEGAEPTVLEVELLPGEGALLAPEWVPWAERLAEYQAAQAALAESEGGGADEADDAESDDDLDDDADLDEDDDSADFSEDGSRILHAGDLDGVDIDELDDSASESEDDESDDDDDESDDDDDDDDESDDDDDDDESEDEDEDEDDEDDDDDD